MNDDTPDNRLAGAEPGPLTAEQLARTYDAARKATETPGVYQEMSAGFNRADRGTLDREHQPWPERSDEDRAAALERAEQTSRRKLREAICVEVVGVARPRNRRERRKVLHAMRAQARPAKQKPRARRGAKG